MGIYLDSHRPSFLFSPSPLSPTDSKFFHSRSTSGQLKKFKGINVADLIHFISKFSKKGPYKITKNSCCHSIPAKNAIHQVMKIQHPPSQKKRKKKHSAQLAAGVCVCTQTTFASLHLLLLLFLESFVMMPVSS